MFNVSHPAYLHVNFFKNITDHFLTRESFRYHGNVDCLVGRNQQGTVTSLKRSFQWVIIYKNGKLFFGFFLLTRTLGSYPRWFAEQYYTFPLVSLIFADAEKLPSAVKEWMTGFLLSSYLNPYHNALPSAEADANVRPLPFISAFLPLHSR
jgi:hypothetical protein